MRFAHIAVMGLVIALVPISLALAAVASDIPVPSIAVNPDIYYPLDEILYLEGKAKPNATIQIHFQKQGAKPLNFNAKSDRNGEWVLAEKVPLAAGDWEVRARVLIDNDISSEWSNPRVFKVIINGITIGGVNLKFAALSFVILILLVVGCGVAVYFFWRVKRLQSALMSKEIREAHQSVHEGLSEIRRDLLGELRLLESAQRPLSQQELAHKEQILQKLDKLEQNMEQQIEDIREKT